MISDLKMRIADCLLWIEFGPSFAGNHERGAAHRKSAHLLIS